MKQSLFILLCVFSSVFVTYNAGAQGLSVNTTGAAANTSAMLDVSSASQGMLVPRMDSTHRAGIAAPATGLLVYQTDGVTPGFYNYNGSNWQKVGAAVQPHVQVYTTPGTYTFTTSANITTSSVFKITLIGAGGGGGGGGDLTPNSAGGGGAGALALYWGAGLSPNTAYTVTVGFGGFGGFLASNGTDGGVSFIDLGFTSIACPGGGGGISADNGGAGGSGSIPSGGTLNAGGGPGNPGSPAIGGNGCSSTYGAGGAGTVLGIPGYGSGSGSGGAGATSALSGPAFPIGGNGAPGIAIIEWSE